MTAERGKKLTLKYLHRLRTWLKGIFNGIFVTTKSRTYLSNHRIYDSFCFVSKKLFMPRSRNIFHTFYPAILKMEMSFIYFTFAFVSMAPHRLHKIQDFDNSRWIALHKAPTFYYEITSFYIKNCYFSVPFQLTQIIKSLKNHQESFSSF